jgi:glucosamine--fructose-6-phosphate aminotransferase (isomerizing)
MIQHDRAQTAMAREIREIPLSTERLLAEQDLVATVAHRIRQANSRVVVISGRGSSGNAGTFLRYLFETRAGLLVSTSAPSVVTTYRQSIDMRNAVFIVISQSGRSPDLVTGAQSARKSGALTIAIVNDVTSPVALACELTLPIGAGPERSVAATKSVVLSMVIAVQLIASPTSAHALSQKITQLRNRNYVRHSTFDSSRRTALRIPSRGFLHWRFGYAGPRCARRHHQGAGIRNPSQDRKQRNKNRVLYNPV